MKIIGLTSQTLEFKHNINTAYVNAFTRPGVIPVILPIFSVNNREVMTADSFAEQYKKEIARYAEGLDALCVTGGQDVNPQSVEDANYASSGCDTIRDYMELALIANFIEAGKPIIGICRGLQIIGLHLKLDHFFQDLGPTEETHDGGTYSLTKRQESPHRVWPRGSYRAFLEEKTGRDVAVLAVNSWHHQGFCLKSNGKVPKMKDGNAFWQWLGQAVGEYENHNKLKILASTASVIEGFEVPDKKIVAHQHHPEEYGPESLAIGYFVEKYLS